MTAQEQARMRDLVARLTLAEKHADALTQQLKGCPRLEDVVKLRDELRRCKDRLYVSQQRTKMWKHRALAKGYRQRRKAIV